MTAKIIKHKFVNPKSDGADATVVRPSNWNDDHAFYLARRTIIDDDNVGVIAYSGVTVAVTLPVPSGNPHHPRRDRGGRRESRRRFRAQINLAI
jgi:hypothetical protein